MARNVTARFSTGNRTTASTEPLESRVLFAGAAVSGAPRPEGLVGYWSLDAADTSGTLVLDRGGRNRHGTLGGAPAPAAGHRREGLAMDGVDDRVLLGGLLAGGASQLSAAAWVYKDDTATDGLVMAKGSTAAVTDPSYAWSLGIAGDVVRVRLRNDAGLYTFAGPRIPTGRWQHIAFTYDGSAVRIYAGGRLRGTYAHAGAIPNSNAQVVLASDGVGDTFLKGRVDEVRLYDRALSGRSVLNLYYRPPSGSSTPAAPAIAENFESGAGGFSSVDGTWNASGGAYRVSAAGTAPTSHLNTRAVHGTVIDGDFALTVDASVSDTTSPWNDFAVVFGYQDTDNYYFLSSNESNDAATNGIFRVVNGVSTALADAAGPIGAGRTYQVRVERSGEDIRAYADGRLIASAVDGTFTSGQIGFGTKGDVAVFDNLIVTGMVAAPPTQPSAPSELKATAVASTRIDVSWTDNSTNESGFKVERSVDGVSFAQVGTVGANVKAYSATGLSPETAYWFRVRAYNAAGDSAYAAAASATTPAAPAGGTLAAPPRAAVDAAIAAPLIRYNRALPGGSYTNGAWSGGGSVTMAVAAFAGDPSADARLLQQARYSLTGGNDPASNGGYPAQHEVLVTSMFAILKHTPRVWNQFTDAERAKIDLVMKAALVSGAFMTGDANPYVAAGQQERTLDADTNVSRGWNPNYREGMAGSVMVGLAYFGVAGAQAVLSGYDHAAFVAQLQAAGLSNIHQTFNWKAANPSSIAPSGATIQAAVRAPYRYFGVPLADVMGIYGLQVADTYADVVTAGLNDGAGINGAGRIVSGAETLPNRGARGMLKEFNSLDAGGPRSSASYAYYGFRPHTANALALIASGLWDSDTPAAKMAAARLEVGNTDLWYKLDRGYIGYAKGGNSGLFSVAQDGATWGFAYTRPLWEAVLRPFLQQNVTP